jgi:hypothetical protein
MAVERLDHAMIVSQSEERLGSLADDKVRHFTWPKVLYKDIKKYPYTL